MKYEYYPKRRTEQERRELNEQIIRLLQSEACEQAGVTDEDIFNRYTGDGGLHGLRRSDYENYNAFSAAKKELENGQFFTPPPLCEMIVSALRLPNHAHADFVCPTATPNELKARAQRLMGEEETVTADDVLNIDNLEINLATYQVTLDNEPIDLTLMEYSLLSFLATHPNRAYSREVLLHRVWGFEYCGGTRTVDVHIRRIRSKVGPQIAAHITTVRGVGYLFKD